MKLRTPLLFSVFVLLLSTNLANAQWATLKGQFVYGKEGTNTPEADKLTPTKDLQVCGKVPLFDEELVVNPKNRGVSDIVLWAFKPKKVHSDYKATDSATVVLDNLNCRFEPHIVAVRTGQTLEVKNSDPVGHNSMISLIKNQAVNPLIQAGKSVTFDFKKAELLPVDVSCSIHPWMKGHVLVQDHPYMAITDADGKFELKNLPAGKLTLKVWHKKAGYIQSVDVDGKKESWKRGRYSVTLSKDAEHTYTLDPKVFK